MNHSPCVSINQSLRCKAVVFMGFEDAVNGRPHCITFSSAEGESKRYEQNLKNNFFITVSYLLLKCLQTTRI